MRIKVLEEKMSVCKIMDISLVDFQRHFVFLGKTDEELSLVCESSYVPENNTECEDGWRCFRIEGELDFSLIGILSKISGILAENKIGIFVVSTYNTDYILVKEGQLDLAIEKLFSAGYDFV